MESTASQTIAVIMGGGAGTRLSPLTQERSKPAVPLAGKYRLIDIPLSNCINSGLKRVFVLTQFNSAGLNRHIATTYRFGPFSNGFVTILAAEQTPKSHSWFQGTADAVRQTMHHLAVYRHKYVAILSGDQLYSMDYSSMLEHHIANNAEITIATIPVVAAEASGFGILKTNEQDQIIEFREKPPQEELEGLRSQVDEEMESAGRVYLASMGIYIFSKDVLENELASNPSYTDFGKELIPNSIGKRRVVSYPFTGYWTDVGTIRSFYEANLELIKQQPAFDLYDPSRPIYTNRRMLPPSKIENSQVQNAMIAEGSVIINSTIENSVVGIRTFIAQGGVVRNSVLMGADYYPWHSRDVRVRQDGPDKIGISSNCRIENAIIDKNVFIGENCVIINKDNVQEGEGEGFVIRDHIVVVPRNTSIPSGTVI